MSNKIYIKDWMAIKPYKTQTNTDLFYLQTTNKVHKFIDGERAYLSEFMDKESLKDFSNFITAYFEDIISKSGIYHLFVSLHKEIYGQPLPFYDTVDYQMEDINLQDVQFLTWYFINLQKQDTFINPFANELKTLAKNIFSVFEQEYEYAPENTQLKKYFSIENPENLDEIRYFMDKLLTKTYLFSHDTGLELYIRTANFKDASPQGFQLYKNKRDNFIINYPTRLLALRANKWAAAFLKKLGKESQQVEQLGLNIQSAFIYRGEEGECLQMEHISSGKIIEVSKHNFQDYKKLKKDLILYGGVNQWQGKYAFTGISKVFEYNDTIVQEAKKDLISKFILNNDEEKKTLKKSVAQQEEIFLHKNKGKRVAFLTPEQAIDFINDFYQTLEKEKVQTPLNDVLKLLTAIKQQAKVASVVLFFNPTLGLEFYANTATEIDFPENPFKENPINPAFLMKIIMSDKYSKEFYDFYYNQLKNTSSPQIEFVKELKESDLDFILRFFKPTRYATRL